MKKTFYSIVEARKKLGLLIHEVRHLKEIIALGHHGRTEVYLVPVDYLTAEKASNSSEALTMDDVSDLWTRIYNAHEIFQHALVFHQSDHNPMAFYYWAAQKKAREILDHILIINRALIKGNYDLQKLKIMSGEKSAWLVQMTPLEEIPVTDMDQLEEWTPLYLKAVREFLCSLAP